MINLTGERFGKLTVKERTDPPLNIKEKRVYWTCICDCGNIATVPTKYLRDGQSRSCGCLKRDQFKQQVMKLGQKAQEKDHTNQKFGLLTAIKIISHNPIKWLCKCNCGNEKIATSTSLQSGHTTSCGCKTHGKGHCFYNPMLSDEDRQNKRKLPEERRWTRLIFKRANFTCEICGTRSKKIIQLY